MNISNLVDLKSMTRTRSNKKRVKKVLQEKKMFAEYTKRIFPKHDRANRKQFLRIVESDINFQKDFKKMKKLYMEK